MRLIITVALTAATATSAYAQRSDDCKYSAERNATVDVANARLLQLDAGAGSLKIEGKPGLNRVVIRGKACASSEDLLTDIKLEARREADRVVVKSNVHDRDDDDRGSWRDNRYARLDVVIEV